MMRFKETDKVGDLFKYAAKHGDLSKRFEYAYAGCRAGSFAEGYDDWTIRELCDYLLTLHPNSSMIARMVVGPFCPTSTNEDVVRHIAKFPQLAAKMLIRCKDLTDKEVEILEESNG